MLQNTTVMPRAQNCSHLTIRNWIEAERNFTRIWIYVWEMVSTMTQQDKSGAALLPYRTLTLWRVNCFEEHQMHFTMYHTSSTITNSLYLKVIHKEYSRFLNQLFPTLCLYHELNMVIHTSYINIYILIHVKLVFANFCFPCGLWSISYLIR